MMIKRLHLWILAVVLTSCTDYIDNPVVTDDKPFSYDLYMEKSVRPGDDFFRYACGKWIDDTSIPSLYDQATQKMMEVTDQLLVKSQDPTVSAMRQLVLAARADDSADFLVLKSRIDYLSAISTQEELLAAFTQLQQWGYTPLVRLSTADNDGVIIPLITSERPSMYLHYAMAYNDLDMLTNYAWDLCENLRNFGFTEERITEIHKNAMVIEEKEMYIYDDSNANQITRPRPQPLPLTRSDDDAYYRKIFRELMGIGDLADQAMISNGEILSFFDYLLDGSDEAIAVLRDYMIFYVLGQDFVFVRRMEPDYGELTRLDEAMKFATYHMYRLLVEARGEEIHKERCREIMEDIRTILIERIDRLDWMSSATKQEAKKKARQMKFLIGYPDQWSDEFTPVIKETTLLEAVTSLRRQSVEWIHKIAGQSTQTRAWDYYCMNHRFSLVNAWYENETGDGEDMLTLTAEPNFELGVGLSYISPSWDWYDTPDSFVITPWEESEEVRYVIDDPSAVKDPLRSASISPPRASCGSGTSISPTRRATTAEQADHFAIRSASPQGHVRRHALAFFSLFRYNPRGILFCEATPCFLSCSPSSIWPSSVSACRTRCSARPGPPCG